MAQPKILKDPVLVTGAMGFIGKRLVERLLVDKYKVITFDLPNQRIPELWRDSPLLEHMEGDISNIQDVQQAVAKAHTIFHLAALVGDWGGDALHHKVTVLGTEYLMQAALRHQCRVVLVSSIVVYGDQINKIVCHEKVKPGKTFGPYSRCKQAQEKLAQQYLQQGLKLSVVRPANVYGAGSKPWVDDLCKEIKSGHPVLVGGGNVDAGLVHVDNVVKLLMLVAGSSKAIGEIYNAADDQGVTWRQYMSALAEIIDAPKPRSIPRFMASAAATLLEKVWTVAQIQTRPPITHEALNLVGSYHRISIDKARKELGYAPVVSFEQGLEEIRHYLYQRAL